ncbi:MAG: CBS domain-containing protein, partial [Pyrobaculum sp.]
WFFICNVKVASVAKTNVVTCTPGASLREAVELMLSRGVGSVVVVDPSDPSRPVGIVGERDVLKAILMGVDLQTPVSEVMNKILITVDVDVHVAEALLAMRENNVRRVIVTKEGKLYGVVALRDLVYNVPLLKIIADYFSR